MQSGVFDYRHRFKSGKWGKWEPMLFFGNAMALDSLTDVSGLINPTCARHTHLSDIINAASAGKRGAVLHILAV